MWYNPCLIPLSFGGQSQTLPLKDRINELNARIRAAAEKVHRPAAEISLMAVIKNVSPERVNEAVSLGIRDLGENRVQEAGVKREGLKGGATLHFIGSLQTNKARRALEMFDVIQSVDRPKLANVLDRAASEMGKTQRCLIEVKISDDAAKSGIPFSEADEFIGKFRSYPNLQLQGLMSIASLGKPEQVRVEFRRLKKLFDAHRHDFGEAPVLSMGMSDDFETAIEEGSTMIRIGRALFGERAK